MKKKKKKMRKDRTNERANEQERIKRRCNNRANNKSRKERLLGKITLTNELRLTVSALNCVDDKVRVSH